MASSMVYITVFMLIVMASSSPSSTDAITCNDVVDAFKPCMGYINGTQDIYGPCCSSLRRLDKAISDGSANSGMVCRCIKDSVINKLQGNQRYIAADLPYQCDLQLYCRE